MTWRALIPEWVLPVPAEVSDLHWLAYRLHADTDSASAGGVAAALAWVRGGRTAPVTGRAETPVTAALTRAEMWAAITAEGIGAAPPLNLICADLGVRYRAPQPVAREWANGVYLALRWLVGESTRGAPLVLPARDRSGRVLTAEELYAEAVAAEPFRYELPEDRRALRDRVQRAAARSRELAALIEDTQRRLSVG